MEIRTPLVFLEMTGHDWKEKEMTAATTVVWNSKASFQILLHKIRCHFRRSCSWRKIRVSVAKACDCLPVLPSLLPQLFQDWGVSQYTSTLHVVHKVRSEQMSKNTVQARTRLCLWGSNVKSDELKALMDTKTILSDTQRGFPLFSIYKLRRMTPDMDDEKGDLRHWH